MTDDMSRDEEFITQFDADWKDSPERKKALAEHPKGPDKNRPFEWSLNFRNAKLAHRRRVNGSTDAETT